MPITRNRPLIESYSRTSFINTLVVKHLRARLSKAYEPVRTKTFNEPCVIGLEFSVKTGTPGIQIMLTPRRPLHNKSLCINNPTRINLPSPLPSGAYFPFLLFIFSPLGARWGQLYSIGTDYSNWILNIERCQQYRCQQHVSPREYTVIVLFIKLRRYVFGWTEQKVIVMKLQKCHGFL